MGVASAGVSAGSGVGVAWLEELAGALELDVTTELAVWADTSLSPVCSGMLVSVGRSSSVI